MNNETGMSDDVILRLPQVEQMVGYKKSKIYAEMSVGRFPQCIELGPRARGWLKSEIKEHIHRLVTTSRGGSNA